jgi:hypothetical protein
MRDTRHEAAGERFQTAEDAWLWAAAGLVARREGSSVSTKPGVSRPCFPDDIVNCLDALYHQRRITLDHAKVLWVWGERQAAPDPRFASERRDSALWAEAMRRLDAPLRHKRILA